MIAGIRNPLERARLLGKIPIQPSPYQVRSWRRRWRNKGFLLDLSQWTGYILALRCSNIGMINVWLDWVDSDSIEVL